VLGKIVPKIVEYKILSKHNIQNTTIYLYFQNKTHDYRHCKYAPNRKKKS